MSHDMGSSVATLPGEGDDWLVGSAGVASRPSPFPRINAQRDRYLSTEYSVESERAVLVTEAYRLHQGEPQVVKVARAFAHVLANMTISIDDLELIVGDCAASAKACPVFPEFSVDWVVDEVTHQPFRSRPHNRYQHTAEVDEQLLGIADFWSGQTVSDLVLERLSAGDIRGSTHEGEGVYSVEMCIKGGIGHVIPHFDEVYAHGWRGMHDLVAARLDDLDPASPEHEAQRDFHSAQLIVIDASIELCRRYASLARDLAGSAQDTRRAELEQIAANCEWIAENPPRTVWETIQLGFLIATSVLIESNGHSVSFGRFDQAIYPYYVRDISSGAATPEFVQELIESVMIKFCGFMKLRDWRTTQHNNGRGLGGLTVTLGGVDEQGRDASNELTHMVLDALAHTRLSQPWVMVRLHPNTPQRLLAHVAQVIKIGTGEPKVINDGVIIPAMVDQGRSLEEARDYSIVGLVEPDLAGREYGWHDSAYLSMAKVLELALNNGQPIDGNGPTGPATGSLAEFESFEQVQAAFEKQMSYWVYQMARAVRAIDLAHQSLKPLPYLSLVMADCTQNGRDVTVGGARYNSTGVQAVGLGTVADGLAAIKHLVFDTQQVSGADVLAAMTANWEGYDYLYALVNGTKVPHYGNDDPYADYLARYVASVWCQQVSDHADEHGGRFQPGMFSVSSNIPFGKMQGASPDGRRAGEPLSDGIAPVHNEPGPHDYKGITALINSAARLNQNRLTNGALLNVRVLPSSLEGPQADDNLTSLIRTYFKQGGSHMQIYVESREILLDADEHPDRYAGLLVYVNGYSTLWEELGEELKKDIIARTELSFDDNTALTPPF
jgi:(2S)-3-sulfopropanediol dehydratase